jgi:hypothetical protein
MHYPHRMEKTGSTPVGCIRSSCINNKCQTKKVVASRRESVVSNYYQSSIEETPSLYVLGQEINDKHLDLERSSAEFERSSLEKAREIGRLLTQAKEEVKNQSQSWQKWLKQSCPVIKERTARLYMQVEREYEDLAATVADPDTLSLLSLKEFQKRLNAKNRTAKNTEPDRSSEPDYLAELQNTAYQFEQSLDLFLDRDLDPYSQEALSTALSALASLESRINCIRKQLVERQRSSANCPDCNNALISGLDSCIACGWNVGELQMRDCLPLYS